MSIQKPPVYIILNEHLDKIINSNFKSKALTFALLAIISRYEEMPSIQTLIQILERSSKEIYCALDNLLEIGFLKIA